MRAIHWGPAAETDLLEIVPTEHAIAVDAAVQRFAASGLGFVRAVPRPNRPDELRLYVGRLPYYVLFRFDDANVYVWRVIHRS